MHQVNRIEINQRQEMLELVEVGASVGWQETVLANQVVSLDQIVEKMKMVACDVLHYDDLSVIHF